MSDKYAAFCVYCGHEKSFSTVAERNETMLEHVVECKQNPMGAMLRARDAEIARMGNENNNLCDKLFAAQQRVKDYEDAARKALNDECAPDEKHCACVPHLREELAVTEKALEIACEDVHGFTPDIMRAGRYMDAARRELKL